MTIEMTIAPASADGESFEIATRDVTGISGDDPSRFLQEAEGGQYSRLLFFERDSDGFVSPSDLEPLTNCSSGVYILINTKATPNNRRSVFVGMAGIDGITYENYWEMTRSNLESIDTDCRLELIECLSKKSENPPLNMSNWDLAIIIPSEEKILDFFEKLCNMLVALEEFFPQHKRLHPRFPSKDRVPYDSTRFLMMSSPNIPPEGTDYLIQLLFDVTKRVGLGLLLEFAKRLLWKRPKKKKSSSAIFIDRSLRQKIKVKNSDFSMSIGDVTNNYENTTVNIAFVTESQSQPNDFED